MDFSSQADGFSFLRKSQNDETGPGREVGGGTERTFKDAFPFFAS